MTPAETIIQHAAATGVTLWADQIDGEDVLRYVGPAEALDVLAPALLLFHTDLVALLRDRQPGEPERTADAPWECPCCARFFGEDQTGLEGWCRYCLAVVLDECLRLDDLEEAAAG